MATRKSTFEKSAPEKDDGRKNNGGARAGAGRKPFAPTESERKQVEALSGYGVPIEQIAVLVREGIDADTLRKHFATELISGKAKANGRVGKTLFQKAIDGDTAAAIWWSKTQMKWRETQRHEIAGHDGGQLIQRIERVIVDPSQADTRDDDSRAEHTAH